MIRQTLNVISGCEVAPHRPKPVEPPLFYEPLASNNNILAALRLSVR